MHTKNPGFAGMQLLRLAQFKLTTYLQEGHQPESIEKEAATKSPLSALHLFSFVPKNDTIVSIIIVALLSSFYCM